MMLAIGVVVALLPTLILANLLRWLLLRRQFAVLHEIVLTYLASTSFAVWIANDRLIAIAYPVATILAVLMEVVGLRHRKATARAQGPLLTPVETLWQEQHPAAPSSTPSPARIPTKSNRLRTGFHRVGVALSIVPLALALGLLGFGLFQWASPLVSPPVFRVTHEVTGKSMDVRYSTDKTPIVERIRATFGDEAPDAVIADIKEQLRIIEVDRNDGLQVMGFGLVSLLIAGLLYGSSRLVGWIASGFIDE